MTPKILAPFRKFIGAPALGFRDFKLLWLSTLFNSIGFVGEQVLLGWIVLTLTDSPFMVGAALALRMAPLFLIGVFAGAFADRVDRRALLRGVSLGMAGLSLCLFLLIFLDQLLLGHLLLVTFAGGCLRALHQPARQSLAYDIVGKGNLVNGLSFLSLSMRLGGIFGALGGGVLLGLLGADFGYGILVLAYICSAITLQFMGGRASSSTAGQESLMRNLKELATEIRLNNSLKILLVLAAAVEILGFSHQALLPVLARDVLHVGPEGLGLMTALRSVGGIVAILCLSSFGDIQRKGLLYLGLLYIFGICLLFLGVAQTFLVAILAILLINGAAALCDIMSQALVQTAVPNHLRGRAMGSWVLAMGLAPVGHLQIGALASLLGVTAALFFHGFGLLALAFGTSVLFPKLKRL